MSKKRKPTRTKLDIVRKGKLCKRCYSLALEARAYLRSEDGALRWLFDNADSLAAGMPADTLVEAGATDDYTRDSRAELERVTARLDQLKDDFEKLRARHVELAHLVAKHGP